MHPQRIIAFGDIHGQLSLLEQLLEQVAPRPSDQLVFLGDYIDRGPDSRGVIERLLQLARNLPGCIFLRGNHEQLLLDSLSEHGILKQPTLAEQSPRYAHDSAGNATLIHLFNGGKATLASYGMTSHAEHLPIAHLEFLLQTRLFWAHPPYLFVHAGADPAIPPDQQDPFTLLWDRQSPPGRNGVIQVVGHQPTRDGRPEFTPGQLRIDTGAGYGGPLTCCEVQGSHCWQATPATQPAQGLPEQVVQPDHPSHRNGSAPPGYHQKSSGNFFIHLAVKAQLPSIISARGAKLTENTS